MANIPQREGSASGGEHPKNQSAPPPADRDIVKRGSTDPGKAPAGTGPQPAVGGWPQPVLTDDDRAVQQKRQQEAWDLAAEREKSNNPATKPQRQYDKNAPGMHPANQPEPTTKINKATRLDLEDVTGNPGHRGVNPDAPAGSINGPGVDRTGKMESINEPSHIDQNWPQRTADGVQPGKGPTGPRPGTLSGAGVEGSINEPLGSQVIPPGAGQGAGGAAGGIGAEYEHPEIDSMHPDEIELGTPDITVRILGSGFTDKSTVTVEGEEQPAEFVDEGEMTTVMKPSLYSAAGVVEVVVKNGGYASEGVEFEFLDAAVPPSSRQSKRTKPKPAPKGKGKR